MLTPYELFVGLRYTRAKRKNHFISFISVTSMMGIGLGVAALIVVLSVMNGFQRELRATILGVVSHIQVMGVGGRIDDWPALAEQVRESPEVIASAPYVMAEGLLSHGKAVRGTAVRGILPEQEETVADIGAHMSDGSLEELEAGRYRIVLGIDLAHAIGAGVGDKVMLIAPQGQVTPAGILPRLRQFTIVGIFELKNYQYDSGLALVHLKDAQTLFRFGDAVSGLRLKVKDLFAAPRIAAELANALPANLYASDWTRSNANFFRAVQIEKRVMFIILLLIVAVAAFNIVSTLVMAVTDKRADIAILRTLGAAPGDIMKIFIVQGALIGVIGTIAGLFFGLIVAFNIDVIVPAIEQALGFKILAKDVYYISDLPSEVQAADVLIIGITAFLLTLLATLYPSLKAARTNPAEALQYE